jgi:hypothetical protein
MLIHFRRVDNRVRLLRQCVEHDRYRCRLVILVSIVFLIHRLDQQRCVFVLSNIRQDVAHRNVD